MSKLAYCPWCETFVRVSFWRNENDHGDNGYRRSCCHGDYVPAEELSEERAA